MKVCPAPDCPHHRKFGRPAEFRDDVERCSDCGSSLVPPPLPDRPRSRLPFPRALTRRLLWTGGTVLALWAGLFLPMPLLNHHVPLWLMGQLSVPTTIERGPMSLGLTPFLLGFVLVEFVALAIPGLRRRRHGEPDLRRKLVRAALCTGVGFCLVQGLATGWLLEGLAAFQGSWDAPLVANPGWKFRIAIALAMTAGSCLYVLAARVIESRGVGAGFAVVLLADALSQLPAPGRRLWHGLWQGDATPMSVVLVLAMVAACFAGMFWFFRRSDRPPGDLPVRLPTCGALPLEMAWLAALAPSIFLQFFYTAWATRVQAWLHPDNPWFLAGECVVLAIFVPVGSILYYWRRRREFGTPSHRKDWVLSQVFSAAFLLAVLLVGYEVARLQARFMGDLVPVVAILGLAALLDDLVREVRSRRNAPGGADLVPGESWQDVADAVEAFRDRPVDGACLQGLRFRTLTYFFGPYVPITRLVPDKGPVKP